MPADPGVQLVGCQITVYKEKNFAGQSASINGGWSDLGDDWAGKIASLKVQAGVWRLFDGPAYAGNHEDFSNIDIKDIADRKIASIGSLLCVESP